MFPKELKISADQNLQKLLEHRFQEVLSQFSEELLNGGYSPSLSHFQNSQILILIYNEAFEEPMP